MGETVLENVQKTYAEFEAEAKKAAQGNKAAARRARVKSMTLRSLLKEWKQDSNNQ